VLNAVQWKCRDRMLDLGHPQVMGVLNVTPDSFSDGGRYRDRAAALAHARRMVEEGAAIIDVGGESTRPGSLAASPGEELDRVIPVIETLRRDSAIFISVDTSKPEVMREAVNAGADIINDVRALGEAGALAAAADSGAGICLMHMQGEPKSMQEHPHYDDVVADVARFLAERIATLTARGVARERLTLDPGVGFGKTVAHNFELLARQRELLALGVPLLAGWSRKSSLGAVTGRPVEQRLAASVAAALAAALQGASILRVHDVAETVDALKVWRAAGLLPAGTDRGSDQASQSVR